MSESTTPAVNSRDTWRAASPITWTATAFLAMSSMCPMETRSRCDIERFGLPQDLFPDAQVQELGGDQVHPTALQQPGRLALHADEIESRNVTWLELHQDIDVAVRAEVVAACRAEQRQPRDTVPLAERPDGATVDDRCGLMTSSMLPPSRHVPRHILEYAEGPRLGEARYFFRSRATRFAKSPPPIG